MATYYKATKRELSRKLVPLFDGQETVLLPCEVVNTLHNGRKQIKYKHPQGGLVSIVVDANKIVEQ